MSKIDKVLVSIQQGVVFGTGIYFMVKYNDNWLGVCFAIAFFSRVFYIQRQR